jgi:hypothetical protein
MQQYENALTALNKVVALAQGKLKDQYELTIAKSNLIILNLILAD